LAAWANSGPNVSSGLVCGAKLAPVVIAAPSVHESGVEYEGEPPAVDRLPAMPDSVRAIIAAAKNGARPRPDDVIPAGSRNSTLTSRAGSLRRRGMTAEDMAVELAAVNAKLCQPPLPASEVEEIARSVARYDPAPRAVPTYETRTLDTYLYESSVADYLAGEVRFARIDHASPSGSVRRPRYASTRANGPRRPAWSGPCPASVMRAQPKPSTRASSHPRARPLPSCFRAASARSLTRITNSPLFTSRKNRGTRSTDRSATAPSTTRAS
jgi:hypothetical protein